MHIWELVDELKSVLDARHRPDGYNVGFNDGAAAGQTVRHAHIHAIPRYEGDVPDPRGGIRSVTSAVAGTSSPRLTDERTGEIELIDSLDDRVLRFSSCAA